MELAAIKEAPLDFKNSPEVKQAKDQIMNAVKDLPFVSLDDDDMTLVSMFDNLLIEALYGGDFDAFEENDGYDMRDKMIGNITQALKVAVEKELKTIG
jgi:hypothetical protein